MDSHVEWSDFDSITIRDLYAILALRNAVFVVEQSCVFQDVDGRDLIPGAQHAWIRDGDEIVAYLRVFACDDALKISRVVTDARARNRGLAARLLTAALEHFVEGDLILDAQTQLEAWYGSFGFVAAGDRYWEDGILHCPMRLSR